ncbi:MAG TPA: sulfatase [Candidatus Polarisedimenticolaceae bacterium]
MDRSRMSWIVVRAAQGAAAGMAVGVVLGAWASRVHGDGPHHMAWLALGRILPGVSRIGLAGMILSVVVAVAVAGTARFGRRAGIVAGALIAGLGAWGVRLALGPYRSAAFPLEGASSAKLTAVGMAVVIGLGACLVVARAVDAFRRGSPGAPRPAAAVASRVVIGAWLLASVAHLAYPAIGSMRARGRPSVLVVCLDTLRADRLGVYGNPRGLTPRLDVLAGEGVVFERAIAPSPWTLATHASLFTSKLPFDHDARLDFMKIHPVHRMLAEDFREAGYRTAAFTADGYVSATFGFGQGFEIYDEKDDGDDGLPRSLDLALRWIRGAGNDPFFVFLHTYAVHSPYTHADRADPAVRGRLGDRFTNVEIEEIRAGRLTLTTDEREWVRGLYDGDVAYTDRLVGEFLETLRRDGILDEVILVVTSDHGDDLWDHSVERSPGHGHSLYQELIHVPLFVRWPNGGAAKARVGALVSLLDVAPTLLDLAGVPASPDHAGRSLAAACRTGSEPPAAPVTAESTEYGPDRFAILEGTYKVIFTPWPAERNMGVAVPAAPLEIFDLAVDPAETTDLSPRLADLPPEVIRMVAAVRARGTDKKPAPIGEDGGSPQEPVSDELLQRLKALGYIR